jgi:hypothetical protein
MQKNMNILMGLGFTENYLNLIARDSGFIKRIRKLNGQDYLTLLLFNVAKGIVSYNTMASTFLKNMDKSVFKQALHKAMSKSAFIVFIERIFNELLQSKLDLSNNKLKSKFKRIIIQDSTVIKLPQGLFEYFSGVKNQITQVANARMQLAFDLKSNVFLLFSIDPYSINDLLAAPKLLIRKGDLIIRDRGYCCLAEIRRIMECKADFIYRYYHAFKYYDLNTGQVLNIYELVKNKRKLTLKLRIGKADGPIVTLLAERVKEDIANKRRVQLKKSSKRTPSKELLQLLSWSIFFTSIEDEEVEFEEIFALYSLRWRIEIIFKAMKSHLNLDKIHNVPKHQLTFILLGKMILLVIITQFIYAVVCNKIYKRTRKIISLFKLVRYLKDNINMIEELMKSILKENYIGYDSIELITKYCSYDLRKDRKNYEQEFTNIYLS